MIRSTFHEKKFDTIISMMEMSKIARDDDYPLVYLRHQ